MLEAWLGADPGAHLRGSLSLACISLRRIRIDIKFPRLLYNCLDYRLPHLPSSEHGESSGRVLLSCNSLSKFLSKSTLSSPPGLEPPPRVSPENSDDTDTACWGCVYVGVVATDTDP